jgi:hypothetical protein
MQMGRLLDKVLDDFYEDIVKPIDGLGEVGIDINQNWRTKNGESTAARRGYLKDILQGMQALQKDLPYLSADKTRLEKMEGDLILDKKTATELFRIRQEIARLSVEMVDKPELFEKYRELSNVERGLKGRSSGLDRHLYERVFNGTINGQPCWKNLTRVDIARKEALEFLDKAIRKIDEVGNGVKNGLDKFGKQIQNVLSTPEKTSDEGSLRQIDGELRIIDTRIKEASGRLSSKMQILREYIKKIIPNAAITAYQEICARLHKVVDNVRAELLKQKEFREVWEDSIADWVADLENPGTSSNDIPYIIDLYIRNANVVGLTCNESRRVLEEYGFNNFDTVIIDEISRALPVEMLMPMMLARKAILIGDPRQLPPIFKENSLEEVINDMEENGEVDEATGLTRENYEKFKGMATSSIFNKHFTNANELLKAALLVVYRHHPQIIDAFNLVYFYTLRSGLSDPDGIKPGSNPTEHRLHRMTLTGPTGRTYTMPAQHSIWIDSSYCPLGKPHYEKQAGTSKTNDLEAILAAKILADINDECKRLGYTMANPKPVAVITLYGRQVGRVRMAIEWWQREYHRKFESINYDVNSVDRFQGREAPIVIVSLVRNKMRMPKSPKSFAADFRRINVAMSRAQELLIVLGAKNMFYNFPVEIPNVDGVGSVTHEIYRVIIDNIQRNGRFFESSRVIDAASFQNMMTRLNPRMGR